VTDEMKNNLICNFTVLAASVVLVIASFWDVWFVPLGTVEFGLGFFLAAVTTFNLRNRYRQHIEQLAHENIRCLLAVNSMVNVALEVLKRHGMTDEQKSLFAQHVHKTEAIALACKDEDRRLDAIRTLGWFVVLLGVDDDPDPGEEKRPEQSHIIMLARYR